MYNTKLLDPEVQDFILNFQGVLTELIFSGSPFAGVTIQELAQQIESRNRIRNKLPTWHNARNILYPSKLNLEQTSSEITSGYKSKLVKGRKLADITGGFGVDTFYLSKNFESVDYFERNPALGVLAKHNFGILGANNISCHHADGLEAALNNNYDVIYADPSRRHEKKGKVFFLEDCEPNIPQNLDSLLNHCKTLFIKTSPMLDISVGLNDLHSTTEIHIVAVENEVKELLWIINNQSDQQPLIKTINLSKHGNETFDFLWKSEAQSKFSHALRFLYEPNAAIMKSGAFDLISQELEVYKLHSNTQLYTSEELKDFPGRKFEINQVIPYSKKEMRNSLEKIQANVAVRNFPESVEVIKRKWKIADGGDRYLFFTTTSKGIKEVLVCSKV